MNEYDYTVTPSWRLMPHYMPIELVIINILVEVA